MRSLSRFVAALVSAALLASLTITNTFAGKPSTTQIHYVDDDGQADVGNGCGGSTPAPTTIQLAINASNQDDTVLVCPGLYEEVINITTSGLTVRSVERWKAIISPPSDFPAASDLLTIDGATGVTIKHFKFRVDTTGECEHPDSLVHVHDSPYTQVRANKFGIGGTSGLDLACGYNSAIYVTGSSGGSELNRNRITDFKDYGIIVVGSGPLLIKYNRINFYHASYTGTGGTGIYAATEDTSSIHNNKVRSLDTGGTTTALLQVGIAVGGSSLDVRGNTIRNANTAIYAVGASSGRIRNNDAYVNIQNGLLFNQSANILVETNQMNATEKGIAVDSSSVNNFFIDNDWGSAAAANDCNDSSSGGGTSNTANTWTNNVGSTSSPPGICAPAP